jgi:hypothetical protein
VAAVAPRAREFPRVTGLLRTLPRELTTAA